MILCTYCGNEVADWQRSCCGEVHYIEIDKPCPKCDSINVMHLHHEATPAVPECWYWQCEDCDEQWGHE